MLLNLLFFRYLNFCPSFFGYVEKRLNEVAEVDFKIGDFTGSKQLQYIYCPISQEVKAIRQ